MDLLQNPFYILGISPCDNRRRIMEQADERSLLLDPNECQEARSGLTNPRRRLSAEVAWLPGISPDCVEDVLQLLEFSPIDLLAVDDLSPIARANLISAGLARLSDHNVDDIVEWILAISWAFEDFDADDLSAILNEERIVSGFPPVSDLSAVDAEIQERRRYYRQVIKSVLDNFSPMELVGIVTMAVESATDNGEAQGPILIADLVDLYEVEAQEFLVKEEENINSLVEKLRAVAGASQSDIILSTMVNQLIKMVKSWDAVAQPIQVSNKSRGLDHGASHRVAGIVRGLAIEMFNQHDMLDVSQQLTNMLQEVFAEVGEIAERTAADADVLEDIAEQKKRESANRAQEWLALSYEADVGVIFKDKLCISPKGIEWKGRLWDLDSITRIRWGGTRHSVNGFPTGTTYHILFGNSSNYADIELKKTSIYTNFIDRLWKTVGVRLLTEYLVGLRDGKKYHFGDAVLTDHGMELVRRKFFGSNERVFCRWHELQIWNEAGDFCIGHRNDKKLTESFPYQAHDNIHVLEAAIRMFYRHSGDRLSCLLGE